MQKMVSIVNLIVETLTDKVQTRDKKPLLIAFSFVKHINVQTALCRELNTSMSFEYQINNIDSTYFNCNSDE